MATIPNTNAATPTSPLREALDARDDAMLNMRYRTMGKIDLVFTSWAAVDHNSGATKGVIDYRKQGPGLALAHGRRGDMLLILGEFEPLPDIPIVKGAHGAGAMKPCVACLTECDECGIGGCTLGKRPCLSCGARLRFRPEQKCSACAGTGYAGRYAKAERQALQANIGDTPLESEADDSDQLGIRCGKCLGAGHIGDPDRVIGRPGCRVCKGSGVQGCATCSGTGKTPTGYARGRRRQPGHPTPPVCGKCQGNRVIVAMQLQPWGARKGEGFYNGHLDGFATYGPIAKIMYHKTNSIEKTTEMNSIEISPDPRGNLAVLLVDERSRRQYIIGGTIKMPERG